MYGLLSEAKEEDKFQISKENYFASGYHSNLNSEVKKNIISQLNAAKQFLKQKESEGKVVFIQITSSESAVPNHDNEDKNKPEKPTGWLRERRAETMKKFIEEQLEKWIGTEIKSIPPFLPFKYSEPTEKYTEGDNMKDPRFNKDIWVRLEMEVMPADTCLVGLTIEVMYIDTPDPSFPCRGNHRCNGADFDVKMNGIVVGNANLNNGTSGGDVKPRPLVISPEKAQQIARNSTDQTLKISLKCKVQNCHSATPEIRISKEGKQIIHTCTSLGLRNDNTEVTVLILDLCGNIITSKNSAPNAGVLDPQSKLKLNQTNQQSTGSSNSLPFIVLYKPGVKSISQTDYGVFKNLATYNQSKSLGEWTSNPINSFYGNGLSRYLYPAKDFAKLNSEVMKNSSMFFKIKPSNVVRIALKSDSEIPTKYKEYFDKKLLSKQINTFDPSSEHIYIWNGGDNYKLSKDKTINNGDRLIFTGPSRTISF